MTVDHVNKDKQRYRKFYASFGSKSVENNKAFKVSDIRPAKIIFTPKPAFKNSLRSSGFEEFIPESK